MKRLKNFVSNLKLKYKLFCLLSLVLVSFSIGGLVLLQYALVAYNDEIHRQSAQSLKVSSALIEKEIEKMKGFSYRLSTDSYLQSYLYDLKETEDDYKAYLIGDAIKKGSSTWGPLKNQWIPFSCTTLPIGAIAREIV